MVRIKATASMASFFFFFSSRRRHTRLQGDWSSDVCSSDLGDEPNYGRALKRGILEARGEQVICDEIDLCDVSFYQRALPLLAEGADLVEIGRASCRERV